MTNSVSFLNLYTFYLNFFKFFGVLNHIEEFKQHLDLFMCIDDIGSKPLFGFKRITWIKENLPVDEFSQLTIQVKNDFSDHDCYANFLLKNSLLIFHEFIYKIKENR